MSEALTTGIFSTTTLKCRFCFGAAFSGMGRSITTFHSRLRVSHWTSELHERLFHELQVLLSCRGARTRDTCARSSSFESCQRSFVSVALCNACRSHTTDFSNTGECRRRFTIVFDSVIICCAGGAMDPCGLWPQASRCRCQNSCCSVQQSARHVSGVRRRRSCAECRACLTGIRI